MKEMVSGEAIESSLVVFSGPGSFPGEHLRGD